MLAYKVFLAHSRGDSSDDIQAQQAQTAQAFARYMPGISITVVPGRDDFDQVVGRRPQARSEINRIWLQWTRDVVYRRDWTSNAPTYSAIVCPRQYVGRATARIVNHALAAGMPVYVLDGDRLEWVTRGWEETESWQDGYRLETVPLDR